jgi:hypothetical protein
VRKDWQAWLPAEKGQLFYATVMELETSYTMLSITLDEALTLRDQGTLIHAREQAAFCADLFHRLAMTLLTVLRALEEHGRHFGTLPSVAPLNSDFFRGETAQHIAWRNSLMSRVLFPIRAKFFHKLRDLGEAVEELDEEFREASDEIASGVSIHPAAHWQALDILHYDLNTCLRETTVLLKSFLCALPDEEVQPFGQKLQAFSHLPPLRARAPLARR